jgi:hypothetical protein
MKLYQLKWIDPASGESRRAYAGSKAAATHERIAVFDSVRGKLRKTDIDIEEVDVPTDKVGLIDWLNRHK